jgi:exosortase
LNFEKYSTQSVKLFHIPAYLAASTLPDSGGKRPRGLKITRECVAQPVEFRLSSVSPGQRNISVSPLAQTNSETVRPAPVLAAGLPWWQLAVLALLSLWLYAPTLTHLVGQWWHDPNFSHGFFVPLFSGFIAWQERDRLRRIIVKPVWSGMLVLAFALCVLIVGQLGAELFLARISLLLLASGLIVLFLGWDFLRARSFPLSFLLLMIPIPTIIFNQITFPLQLLASRIAAAMLPILSVPILREGNVIILPSMALEVAEACSGIRSLMSLVTLAIIYGYLAEKRQAVRWLLALGAIPISVAANSVRIIGTGLLVQYWDPDKAQGFFHAFSGWLIFVVSLVMLYLLHSLTRILWREKGSEQ